MLEYAEENGGIECDAINTDHCTGTCYPDIRGDGRVVSKMRFWCCDVCGREYSDGELIDAGNDRNLDHQLQLRGL